MAVGSNVGFPGEAIPLHGNSEIRQVSSAGDVMTITLNSSVDSTSGGRGLVVNRYAADSPISSGGAIFSVEYDGVRARRHVISTLGNGTATAATLSASQSGALFMIGLEASAVTATLPAPQSGVWFEFYANASQTASGLTIAAPTCGTLVGFNDAAADSIKFASVDRNLGGSLRFISDGTKWYVVQQPALSSVAPSTTVMTVWNWVT